MHMRLFGSRPPNVEVLNTHGDLSGLIRALGYVKNASVRRAAATALGGFPCSEAIDALLSSLKDPDGTVCEAVVGALHQIGEPRATTPLVRCLGHLHINVREAAAKALAEIGGAASVDALIAHLLIQTRTYALGCVICWGQLASCERRNLSPPC